MCLRLGLEKVDDFATIIFGISTMKFLEMVSMWMKRNSFDTKTTFLMYDESRF